MAQEGISTQISSAGRFILTTRSLSAHYPLTAGSALGTEMLIPEVDGISEFHGVPECVWAECTWKTIWLRGMAGQVVAEPAGVADAPGPAADAMAAVR